MQKSIKKNSWKKAQTAEKKHYNTHSDETKHSETECRQYVLNNFKINFEFFRENKILEVGCGSGGLIHYINVPCFRVGIDPLFFHFRSMLIPTRTHIITGVGENLPFKNESFDIILCLNVLDHTLNPEKVIKEIRRVLKEDGLLLLHLNTFQLPEIFLSKLSLIDQPHPHHYSPKGIISLIEEFDFKIEQKKEKRPKLKKWKNFISFFLFRFRIIYVVGAKIRDEDIRN